MQTHNIAGSPSLYAPRESYMPTAYSGVSPMDANVGHYRVMETPFQSSLPAGMSDAAIRLASNPPFNNWPDDDVLHYSDPYLRPRKSVLTSVIASQYTAIPLTPQQVEVIEYKRELQAYYTMGPYSQRTISLPRDQGKSFSSRLDKVIGDGTLESKPEVLYPRHLGKPSMAGKQLKSYLDGATHEDVLVLHSKWGMHIEK